MLSSENHNHDSMSGEDVDALLADELNRMSLDERNRMWEEIHGVDQPIEETDELVGRALAGMEEELDNITNKRAYDSAADSYKKDRRLRMKFVRCEYFNAKKAAARLVKFMDGMLRYFGPEALHRPICLSDLTSDDIAYLKVGVTQLLPRRDRTGRLVFCDFNYIMPKCYKQPQNTLRAFIYLFLVISDDEESQKRGFVSTAYYVGDIQFDVDKRALYTEGGKITEWLPVRLSAFHLCFSHPLMKPFVPFIKYQFSSRIHQGARVRVHYGSHQECQYSLKTFGMPGESIPISYIGNVKNTSHLKWLTRRQAIEKRMATALGNNQFYSDVIEFPANSDILCGRGKPLQDHPGNVLLRELAESILGEYEGAPYGLKIGFHENVLRLAKQKRGARFLKQETVGWWVEASDEMALEKVAHAFRTVTANKARRSKDAASTTSDAVTSTATATDDRSKRARVSSASTFDAPFVADPVPSSNDNPK